MKNSDTIQNKYFKWQKKKKYVTFHLLICVFEICLNASQILLAEIGFYVVVPVANAGSAG